MSRQQRKIYFLPRAYASMALARACVSCTIFSDFDTEFRRPFGKTLMKICFFTQLALTLVPRG